MASSSAIPGSLPPDPISNFFVQRWPHLEHWRFEVGKTPYTNFEVPLGAGVIYLVFIWALHAFMRNRQPVKSSLLTGVMFVHNVLLSIGSGTLLLLIVHQLIKEFQAHGYETLLCDKNHVASYTNGTLVCFFYYLFYLSKIYEFLDTVFLILKKRPIIFLHVYHHFITLILAWVCQAYLVPVQWLSICANLAVHTLMYYYYALASVGRTVSWKQHLTTMQIVQFVLDLLLGSGGFLYSWYSNWSCAGHPNAWLFGQLVIYTFLALFIQFFARSYGKKGGVKLE